MPVIPTEVIAHQWEASLWDPGGRNLNHGVESLIPKNGDLAVNFRARRGLSPLRLGDASHSVSLQGY